MLKLSSKVNNIQRSLEDISILEAMLNIFELSRMKFFNSHLSGKFLPGAKYRKLPHISFTVSLLWFHYSLQPFDTFSDDYTVQKRNNAEVVNHILKNFGALDRLGDVGRRWGNNPQHSNIQREVHPLNLLIANSASGLSMSFIKLISFVITRGAFLCYIRLNCSI